MRTKKLLLPSLLAGDGEEVKEKLESDLSRGTTTHNRLVVGPTAAVEFVLLIGMHHRLVQIIIISIY